MIESQISCHLGHGFKAGPLVVDPFFPRVGRAAQQPWREREAWDIPATTYCCPIVEQARVISSRTFRALLCAFPQNTYCLRVVCGEYLDVSHTEQATLSPCSPIPNVRFSADFSLSHSGRAHLLRNLTYRFLRRHQHFPLRSKFTQPEPVSETLDNWRRSGATEPPGSFLTDRTLKPGTRQT